MNDDPTLVPEQDEVLEGEVVFELGSELEHLTPTDLGLEMPDDPRDAEQVMLRAIHTARADADEYLETLQRLAADFENFRKRAARDQSSIVEHASQRLIQQLLPTLDSFDGALAIEAQTPTEEKLLDGMRGTYSLLMDALGKEGLEVIAAQGEPFDPAVHEAVSGPTEAGEGQLVVSQELRRGYRLGSRVLRPSLVMVEHA